jgi:hypothetical protein
MLMELPHRDRGTILAIAGGTKGYNRRFQIKTAGVPAEFRAQRFPSTSQYRNHEPSCAYSTVSRLSVWGLSIRVTNQIVTTKINIKRLWDTAQLWTAQLQCYRIDCRLLHIWAMAPVPRPPDTFGHPVTSVCYSTRPGSVWDVETPIM